MPEERAEVCACYRSRGLIARICDTGSKYGRLDLHAGARRCVQRMRIGGVSNESKKRVREKCRVSGLIAKMHATDAVAQTASLPSPTSSIYATRKSSSAARLICTVFVSWWIVKDQLALGLSEPPELTTLEGELLSSTLIRLRRDSHLRAPVHRSVPLFTPHETTAALQKRRCV